jgi:iron-regulated transporter 1
MRRIDLTCKLMGPLVIALIDGISTGMAILINFGMNVASVAVEYYAIAKVKR